MSENPFNLSNQPKSQPESTAVENLPGAEEIKDQIAEQEKKLNKLKSQFGKIKEAKKNLDPKTEEGEWYIHSKATIETYIQVAENLIKNLRGNPNKVILDNLENLIQNLEENLKQI